MHAAYPDPSGLPRCWGGRLQGGPTQCLAGFHCGVKLFPPQRDSWFHRLWDGVGTAAFGESGVRWCHSLIGMGAVVLKDVPEGSVMAGNPARRLRANR